MIPSLLFWSAAGACAYLFLLNRVLIQMQDAHRKSAVIRAGGILSVVIAGTLGHFAANTGWLIVPVTVLVVTGLGEIRRLIVRWRCRGARPVAQEGAGIHLTRPLTTTDLAVRRYAIVTSDWRGPALRIAHVSDFHLNSHLPLIYYEGVMRRIAGTRPDLLFFTGDFVTHAQYADQLPGLLSLARGRLGAFGVLGNHDLWADSRAVAKAVTEAGVTLLGNSATRIAVGNGPSILIAGCEAPWSPQPRQPPAVVAGELGLMLTHTPDNIYSLSHLGYTAIFAGHYHGGQIRLPGLGPLVVPSRYGRRFDHGHFVMNGTHAFVTAGVGSAEPPIRIWCQPDVFIVDVEGSHA